MKRSWIRSRATALRVAAGVVVAVGVAALLASRAAEAAEDDEGDGGDARIVVQLGAGDGEGGAPVVVIHAPEGAITGDPLAEGPPEEGADQGAPAPPENQGDEGGDRLSPAEPVQGAVVVAPAGGAAPGAPVEAIPMPVTPRRPVKPGEPLRFNFQGAPLADVLRYLSEAAGFVIIQEVPVSGTVNVISEQELTPDEAVDLLNTLLIDKGFVALRSGRFLRVIDRKTAPKRSLPVYTATKPDAIPKTDEMATMVIPVGLGNAAQLLENLRPLMPEGGTMSANEASNAILITDTQNNARRMAEIIRALDGSVSALSTIRVFALEYADATELAKVVSELFAASGGSSSRSRSSRFQMMFGRGPREGGDQSSRSGGAAGQVVTTADERTNSLIVGAPEDTMPLIADIVKQIDTNIEDITEVQLFPLQHADATELAEVLTSLYEEDASSSSRTSSTPGGPPFPFFRHGDDSRRNGSSSEQGRRQLQQSRVVAIGDPRTNTLIVRAARSSMIGIAEMVGRLDSTDERTQRVHVYPLRNADVESVARILQGMFEDSTSGGSTRGGTSRNSQSGTGTSRLTERSSQGASSDISNTLGGRSGR